MVGLILLLALAGQPRPGGGPDSNDSSRQKVHAAVWSGLQRQDGPLPVWVFLADKGVTTASLDQALAAARGALHPRALARRQLRRTAPGLVDERDLPIHDSYVASIVAAGGGVRTRSRWLNAVSVQADAAAVRNIAALSFVRAIEPVRRIAPVPIEVLERRPGVKLPGRLPPRINPKAADPLTTAPSRRGPAGLGGGYGPAEAQLQQIGITAMHAAGYTGSGVIIGVLDTGFQLTHEAFTNPLQPINVLAQWDFINADGNAGFEDGDPPGQHSHGTIVLGSIAGHLPDEYIGGAPDAAFILAKTEDTTDEYPAEEDFYVAGLEFIEAGGADLATSSLGYIDWYVYEDLDGQTAVTTIAVNVATANGVVCCTAAGNGGHDGDLPSLIAPADALEVLTCGAVDELGELAGFSSNGPSADGRIKPEVLARGVATHSLDPFDDAGYITANGTSLSTPLVAASAALLIQAHPDWTVEQIRSALLETADYFVANGEPDPLSLRGYGVIDVFAAAQLGDCSAAADCADADRDGVRDDACIWWACDGGECAGTPTVFADLGGTFGSCQADGVADGNDRFHALSCFANTTTTGAAGYPCEVAPPQAFNVDAGGPFGDCHPDGVCDGNDAFHALNSFDGTSTCSCPSAGSGPGPAGGSGGYSGNLSPQSKTHPSR